MIAVVFSRDPVAKGVARILGLSGLLTSSGLEVRKAGEVVHAAHGGDSTEFEQGWEEALAEAGALHLIFISRHEMAKPRPMLTAHAPGAEGGASMAYAELKSWLLRRICAEAPEGYECAMEATHHEPNTAKLSATFVEVGSSEAQWGDERALEALASAVADLASFKPSGAPVAMSVGDLHYSLLTDEVLRGEIDLGHVIRKDLATPSLIDLAFEKHVARPRKVVFYRKSLRNPLRQEVAEALRRLPAEVEPRG